MKPETTKKPDSKLNVKKTVPKGKAATDPNKPKQPSGPSFAFMEDFRKQFKAENPGKKSIFDVGRAGGVKWKSMTDIDKAPYISIAEKRRMEYQISMEAYNKKQATGSDEDVASEKSKSEVHDEEGSDEELTIKPITRKKPDSKLNVKKTTPKAKAAKDPNMPKKPSGPFFAFLEDFRKHFKAENPGNKSFSDVSKAGSIKWKSMTDYDKAPYVSTAEKRKMEYKISMEAYNKKQTVGSDEGVESDKSKSEVDDEEASDEIVLSRLYNKLK